MLIGERPVSDTLFSSCLVSTCPSGTHLAGDSMAMTASDNVEQRADLKTPVGCKSDLRRA